MTDPSHRRGTLIPAILLTAWLLAGAAGAWAAYRVVTRPANAYATSVTLRPRAGGYGPVHLSVMTLPLAAQTGEAQAIVLVNPGHETTFLVSLPDRRMFVTDAGSQAPASDVPFTVEEMSRRFPAGADPAGVRELWSIISGAADAGGLSTRPGHFAVVDATPWDSFWRGRGGRRLTLGACGVVAWGAVAIELVRRCRRWGVR